ncbi:hypothetical protein V6Z12_D02G170900 [Gossypium hirsutum]
MGSEYFAQIVPNNYYCKGQHVSRIEGSIKIHFQHSAFWRPPTFNPNKAIRNLFLRQRPLEVKRGFLGMKKQ